MALPGPGRPEKVKSQIWKSGTAIMQENFRDVVENVINGP